MSIHDEYDGPERRSDNQNVVKLLSNMDKNIALVAQDMGHIANELKAHIEDDKKTIEKTDTRLGKIENKLAWYAGAIAIFVGGIELASKFRP